MKKFFITIIFLIFTGLSYAQSAHLGKVVTKMNVEGYTYMELENNGNKIWVATTLMDVKVGDMVKTSQGMLMTDFYSKTLKRTFKEIYFVTYVEILNDDKKEPVSKNEKTIQITLAELFSNKEKYDGKSVKFSGVITKSSQNIMGKNWYHIGENGKKYDVVVSSADIFNQNDMVTVEGVITLNKNIGAGYTFPVFIEDGKLTAK